MTPQMAHHLRQIVARGAGLQPAAVSIAPPRVSSFLNQTPTLPPVTPFSMPGEDRASATEPTKSSPVAPAVRVEAAPPSEVRSASLLQRSEEVAPRLDHSVAAESQRGEVTEIRVDRRDTPEPSASVARPHAAAEPSTLRVELMSSPRTLPSSPPGLSSITSRSLPVAVTPALARPTQHAEQTIVEIPVPVPAGVDRSAPALPIEARSMNEPASQAAEPLKRDIPAIAKNSDRSVVWLEPTFHTAAPEVPIQPASVLSDKGSTFEVRLPPALPHERIATAPPPRQEVRVTIGQVAVRVESNTPPAPIAPRPAAPSDPFASLAWARRGWRAIF